MNTFKIIVAAHFFCFVLFLFSSFYLCHSEADGVTPVPYEFVLCFLNLVCCEAYSGIYCIAERWDTHECRRTATVACDPIFKRASSGSACRKKEGLDRRRSEAVPNENESGTTWDVRDGHLLRERRRCKRK